MGYHHGKEGVGGDVEGDTEEDIGAALVELAGEVAVAIDVELEEGVAGGEGHFMDFTGVPGADDVASGVGV